MSGGFYKRQRAILEYLEKGEISLFELGIHDFLCLRANAIVDSPTCTIPPGIVFTSAPAILPFCPKQTTLRSIQRVLENLEARGLIKRWIRPHKGNYPVLLARLFTVADLSGNQYEINAAETVDWRHPKLEPVTKLSPIRHRSGVDVSPYREIEKGERGSLNHHPTEDHSSFCQNDDDQVTELDRVERLQEKAKAILVRRGEDPEFVSAAIEFIDQRSFDLGKAPPVAEAYYISAFDNLKHNSSETHEIWEKVNRSRSLRAKYMPDFTGFPENDAARQEFNRGVAARMPVKVSA